MHQRNLTDDCLVLVRSAFTGQSLWNECCTSSSHSEERDKEGWRHWLARLEVIVDAYISISDC
jgi:hypothetical protein